MQTNLFTQKTIVKSEYTYVPVDDFKAFLELISPIKFAHFCDYSSARIRAHVVLPNKVELEFDVIGVEIQDNGASRYARSDTLTHVRLSHWMWNNVHASGKGARSQETWNLLRSYFELIPGMDQHAETVVVFAQ